jgi:oligopeptidase A
MKVSFEVNPSTLVAALTDKVQAERALVDTLAQGSGPPTWDNTLAPLEQAGEAFSRWWAPISHLHQVKSTPALREAYQACLPVLTDYHTDFYQHQALFQKIQAVQDAKTEAEQALLAQYMRDFKLSGVALPEAARAEFKTLQNELSELQNMFDEHVMSATDEWEYHLTDESLLAGVPESTKILAQQTAEQKQLPGFFLTLDYPCYSAVISYADNAELRQKLYRAYVTRASDLGEAEWNNTPLLPAILNKRHQSAKLLGFPHYMAWSLETKMAGSETEVRSFLTDLVDKVRPQAQAEWKTLQAFALKQFGVTELQPWDVPYYSEKLKKTLFSLDDEALRPYFPIPRVWQGLCTVIQTLFGITFSIVSGTKTWHPDVILYALTDETESLRGYLYADLYARKHKQGGAWMDECVTRQKMGSTVEVPVAFLTTNFQPSVGKKPALLTHDDVVTLFHEMGHCLHHLLTQVDYPGVAGIHGVAWDAVELPSQMLENWCFEKSVLPLMSGHYETGEPFPFLAQLIESRHFQAGLALLRQLEMSLFDVALHTKALSDSPQAVYEDIQRQIGVIPSLPENRFACSFSHIFAGGYAAGYYSYLWAEVLSSDAFSLFEETGVLNPETGRKWLHEVLEWGSVRSPMALFEAFRGRKFTLEAFLRHRGIL